MRTIEHAIRDRVCQHLLQVIGHRNQDKILLGPENDQSQIEAWRR
jgi:hypothetical protein